MILALIVITAVSLHAVYRSRRRFTDREAELTVRRAELERTLAELNSRFASLPAGLIVELDFSSNDVLPGLRFASEQTEPLVSALSRQEQMLGGAGLTLTAAKVEPGAIRLTLTPVERAGSGERIRRVAEEWNTSGGPLPPGVIAARVDVLAV
jgi:hypothetical protein